MSDANVVGELLRSAAAHPERCAVRDVDSGEEWSYLSLREQTLRAVGAYRQHGMEPGDRVALLMTNSPRYLVAFLGAVAAGLVVVPLNTRLTAQDHAHMVTDSGSRLIVTESRFATTAAELRSLVEVVVEADEASALHGPAVGDVVARNAADLCTLMYTSGTTGAPKAVMLSHGAWSATADTSTELLDFADQPRVLQVAPLTHGAGFMLLPTLRAGGVNLVSTRFDPAGSARLIADGEVDGLFLVPSMIRMLLDAVDEDWKPHPRFRWLYYAGSPITPDSLFEAIERFDGRLLQSFAQMEAPMFLTALDAAEHRAALEPGSSGIAASAGTVISGRTVRIVDEDGQRVAPGAVGEIVARAPQLMNGYWNRPEATATAIRDGWLHTGDLGRFDEHGRLHVVDRVKDMIVTGGSNVYAREVEDVAVEAPGIAEVAVIGLPHRVWGEEVTAVAVATPGREVDEGVFQEFCRARLAGYKVPKRLVLVDVLPRNPYGKVLKRDLKSLLGV